MAMAMTILKVMQQILVLCIVNLWMCHGMVASAMKDGYELAMSKPKCINGIYR